MGTTSGGSSACNPSSLRSAWFSSATRWAACCSVGGWKGNQAWWVRSCAIAVSTKQPYQALSHCGIFSSPCSPQLLHKRPRRCTQVQHLSSQLLCLRLLLFMTHRVCGEVKGNTGEPQAARPPHLGCCLCHLQGLHSLLELLERCCSYPVLPRLVEYPLKRSVVLRHVSLLSQQAGIVSTGGVCANNMHAGACACMYP